ncbi:MAG TPA: HlyD family type I secretion periplasmic adaptor subunit [Paracoccaceae bacterium]|nr:HlyD family type I secretion periplasmic adaptor subunit [Paracoccaceae bacterium]
MATAIPPPAEWSARGALSSGIAALVLLVGGLGFWGSQAEISGAVLASGMIQVESNRQVIQHPDGGVVAAILVKEGDTVAPGDVLIRLDGSRIQSELAIVEGQLREIAARQARLEAERDAAGEIVFPAELLATATPEMRRQVEGEQALFAARNEALAQQEALLAEQNAQIGNRIAGTEAQIEALRTQGGLIGRELEDQQRLYDQRLAPAGRLLELQREEAGIRGQIGRLEAEIAELRGQSAANGIQLVQLKTQRREEAVATLRDLQFREVELAERRLVLTETLSRLEVRAPVGGIVYNSQIFALQSVVQPAQAIMFIVPQDQPMVIQARIEAISIDEVRPGQEASLRFAAFDQRRVPELFGAVTRIAADVSQDEATGMHYYAVEVAPWPEELDKLGDHVLLPGMPVEIFLKTGDRTALAYLVQPLTAFFDRAFRE